MASSASLWGSGGPPLDAAGRVAPDADAGLDPCSTARASRSSSPPITRRRSSPRRSLRSRRSSTASSSSTTAPRDGTAERARGADPRVEVVVHERNEGVGAAIVTGYRRAIAEEIDVTCVMAADGQMDPDDLETARRAPSPRGECDYAKANRLFTGQAWKLIPRTRYLGNAVLSLPHEDRLRLLARRRLPVRLHGHQPRDAQAARPRPHLPPLRVPERHARPPERLEPPRARLSRRGPIYGVGERSGIRLRRVVPAISWLLVKGFFWRMKEKYVIRDFHPLVLFYCLGMLSSWAAGSLLGIVETALRIAGNAITAATIVLVALLVISGTQLLLFAMWFDMESNKDLR